MKCRRCGKECEDRIFGYCKKCAEEQGADRKCMNFKSNFMQKGDE